MKLKGAQLRSFFGVTDDIGSVNSEQPKGVKIPHYQRPFKWKKENIRKLIHDWVEVEHEKQDDHEYFAGSLVTVKESDDGAHQLIDGQQRFTTMFLTNYISYLLSRSILKNSARIKRSGTFSKALAYYKKSSNYLFDSNSFNLHYHELDALIKQLERGDDQEAREAHAKVTQLLNFPDGLLENEEDYKQQYINNLIKDSAYNNLKLTYDRKSYNKSLKSALQHVGINISTGSHPVFFKPEETNSETLNEDSIKYIDAMDVIFTTFNDIVFDRFEENKEIMSDSLDYSLELIKVIDSFLQIVSFCVIQTGDTKDAYLLFEVLNDRSLALDDLDLIKNQFYKNFVLKNSELSDDEIDKTIQAVDEQWVGNIFSETDPALLKKLVSYLGIVFITGDSKVKYTDSSSYRESIQKHLESKSHLTKEELIRKINIFEVCKILIREILDFKFQKTESESLLKEFDSNSSIFHKTTLFLHAKKQYGVLSGLTNFILRYYADTVSDFNPKNMRQEFNNLMHNCPEDIRNQSYELWKTSMLAKDEGEPRKLALKIIDRNHLSSHRFDRQVLDSSAISKLEQDFSCWLSTWSYKKNDFKIRILFAKLIGLDVDNKGEIVKRKVNLSISNENIRMLELDHIEPQKFDSNNASSYFDNPNRDSLVNSLGNMMPLTADLNKSKSYQPVSQGLKYFEDFGIKDHILYIKTKEFLEPNNVPNEDFFIKRSDWLKSIFIKLINFKPDK